MAFLFLSKSFSKASREGRAGKAVSQGLGGQGSRAGQGQGQGQGHGQGPARMPMLPPHCRGAAQALSFRVLGFQGFRVFGFSGLRFRVEGVGWGSSLN